MLVTDCDMPDSHKGRGSVTDRDLFIAHLKATLADFQVAQQEQERCWPLSTAPGMASSRPEVLKQAQADSRKHGLKRLRLPVYLTASRSRCSLFLTDIC